MKNKILGLCLGITILGISGAAQAVTVAVTNQFVLDVKNPNGLVLTDATLTSIDNSNNSYTIDISNGSGTYTTPATSNTTSGHAGFPKSVSVSSSSNNITINCPPLTTWPRTGGQPVTVFVSNYQLSYTIDFGANSCTPNSQPVRTQYNPKFP